MMEPPKEAAPRERVNEWRQQSMRRNQWRRDSSKAVDYFDGNQFDYELRQKYEAQDMPLLYENCIKRWVSTVCGRQATNMTDGVVRVEDNKYEQFGEAMSAKLKEAERVSKTDMACNQAYASAVKAGIGWVEVGDPVDAFAPEHRVETISWREMWWDMSDRSPGLDDAEWFQRIRFIKRDTMMGAFPDHADLIASAGLGNDIPWTDAERYERQRYYERDSNVWSMPDDLTMICVSEFRYRVWVNGYVMDSPSGGVAMFDPENQDHIAQYNAGAVTPRPARYRRVRRAYWIGPHLLHDEWLDLVNNEIGWVPFIWAIEEKTGVPYGMVRDMIPLQDEINTRKAKAAIAIDAFTMIADNDRVMDWNEARLAINRRRGIVRLDPKHPNGRFEVERHPGTTQQNLELYQQAKESIGYIHGLDAPFAGSSNSPDQSGVAIQSLVQQSVTALGTPESNYQFARFRVLQLLLNRVTDRLAGGPVEIRYTRRSDGAKKSLMLNVPITLEDGSVETLDPAMIRRVLVLDDVPQTATFRQAQYLTIVDTLRSMPPEAQAMLLPAMFEMSQLPNRQMYADMARKQLGIGEPKNEQEAQAAAEEAAKKAAAEQAALDFEEAKAAKERGAAGVQAATAKKIEAETAAIEQDMQAQADALANGAPVDLKALLRW